MDSSLPKEINITTWQDFPYSGYKEVNGTIKGIGYAFDLLELLKDHFNFDYKIILPAADKYKSELESMLMQLSNKEVEMAVAFIPIPTQLKSSICKKCIYSAILDETEVTVLMKRPVVSATGSGVLAPFDLTVWMLTLISLLLIGPVMYLIILLRSKFLKCMGSENYSIHSCVWFVYGALLRQGSTMNPISDPNRLLFATWWIFVIILTAFYTANLTAFLTLSQFKLPISTVQDLVGTRYKWFIFANSAMEYIINHNYTDTKLLNESMTRGGGRVHEKSSDLDSSYVLKWIDQHTVFVTEKVFAQTALYENYKENGQCRYVIMPGKLLNIMRGFAFYNGTVIFRPFAQRLKIMAEMGLIKYLKKKELPDATICPLDLGDTDRQLSIADLLLTYETVAVGIGSALLVFLGELIYHRFKKARSNRENAKISRKRKKEMKLSRKMHVEHIMVTPPPPYSFLEKQMNVRKKNINGRDYYVVTEPNGERRLVPIRTPSAFLFH